VRRLSWLLAAALLPAQDETRNPATSPADIEAGAKTFRSHCSPCHGFDGGGGRGPALNTGRFYRATTDAELLRVISDGVEGTEMPGLFYSPDRVWQVVSYLRSLNARPAAKGNAAAGAKLFTELGCGGCHRIRGEGGRLGPDLSEIGRARSLDHLRQAILDPNADVRQRYWVVRYTDASGSRREGFLMNEDTYTAQILDTSENLVTVVKSAVRDYRVEKTSKMPSIKGKATEAQAEDLVAYLASLRPQGESR